MSAFRPLRAAVEAAWKRRQRSSGGVAAAETYRLFYRCGFCAITPVANSEGKRSTRFNEKHHRPIDFARVEAGISQPEGLRCSGDIKARRQSRRNGQTKPAGFMAPALSIEARFQARPKREPTGRNVEVDTVPKFVNQHLCKVVAARLIDPTRLAGVATEIAIPQESGEACSSGKSPCRSMACRLSAMRRSRSGGVVA